MGFAPTGLSVTGEAGERKRRGPFVAASSLPGGTDEACQRVSAQTTTRLKRVVR